MQERKSLCLTGQCSVLKPEAMSNVRLLDPVISATCHSMALKSYA